MDPVYVEGIGWVWPESGIVEWPPPNYDWQYENQAVRNVKAQLEKKHNPQ